MNNQESKLQKFQNNYLLYGILSIAIFVIAILLLNNKKQTQQISEAEEKIKRLESVIKEAQKELKKEVEIRKQLRYNDSITIAHLKILKERDSVKSVRTIAAIKKKYETYTPTELDEALLSAMIASVPGSSPVSLTDSTDRQVKEWCLSVNEQNRELWEALTIKEEIIDTQDVLITSLNNRVASYERDSINHEIKTQAFREGLAAKDDSIRLKDKSLRKQKAKTWLVGIIGVLLTGLAASN